MSNSPLVWLGGKHRLAKKIIMLMPPHKVYVEPFGGAAHVLFTKPPSPVDVYNDLDSGLVNFFRVLRDPNSAGRLFMLANLTPYSREEYHLSRETWADCADPVERAYRWFVVARMSFGGKFGTGNWGSNTGASTQGRAQIVASWGSALARLGAAHERLMRVQVEHQDFIDLIPRYDSPETLFYCDPPYAAETRKSGEYAHELTTADHLKLVDLLLGLQGMAILSGYDTPVYRPLEQADWDKRRFQVVCTAAGRTQASGLKGQGKVLERQTRTECLWISPRATQARRRAARQAAEERGAGQALMFGEGD